MNDAKYIGLDVHQATISATVLDSTGKLVMESILETKAATILQFIHGVRGSLHVTFEEGTCAAWLHDLLKPTSRKCWSAIRGKMRCSRSATKATALIRGNLPSCCARIFSAPSITKTRAYERSRN